MTVETVVNAVRQRLGDVKRERWQDATLALYTSLCQQDICIFTNYYKKDIEIELIDGQLVYQPPKDTLRVMRLEYQGHYLPIESRMQIDAGEAEFPCALKDNLKYNEIEFVLSPTSTSLIQALEDKYGVVTDSDSDGIDTSDCVLEDIHGVVSDVTEDSSTPPVQSDKSVKVYYAAVPEPAYNLTDELVVPDVWFSAFLHYVTGTALQDDNDAANVERGELELKKYQRQLNEIFKITAKDHTSNYASKLTIPQRRI